MHHIPTLRRAETRERPGPSSAAVSIGELPGPVLAPSDHLLADRAPVMGKVNVRPVETRKPVHPRERRRRLLERFERVEPGTGFVLVVDEHPLPLIHWLSERRFGEFEGSFLERGFTWRVRIRRR